MAAGIPVGVLMARSDRVEKAVLPVLDMMQTIPSFVYLIPILMLLGIGKVPGLIAICIYAVPPIIRLTNLGIREVDKETIEASEAFGATNCKIKNSTNSFSSTNGFCWCKSNNNDGISYGGYCFYDWGKRIGSPNFKGCS